MFNQADIIDTLQTIPWFLELNTASRERLADIASLRRAEPGEFLFEEGAKEDYLYVLLEGEIAVEILVPTCGNVRIFTAEPLDVVGWSAVTPLVRQRTASARVLLPVRLLAFEAQSLRKLCDEDHDLGYIIMRRISNVAASRLLTTRLQLSDMFVNPPVKNNLAHNQLE